MGGGTGPWPPVVRVPSEPGVLLLLRTLGYVE